MNLRLRRGFRSLGLAALLLLPRHTCPAETAADPSLLLRLPFDEGGGSLAADVSTNALEAELHGVRWARGAFGTAAWLGGTNSFVEVPPVPGLNGATQFTLSAWAMWEGTGRYPNLVTTHNWSPGGFMFFVSDNACSFRMGRPNHRAGIAGESWSETGVPLLNTLPRGRWVHLAAVFDLPHITTYADGKPVATATWAHPVQAEGLRLGAWTGPVSHHGLIDDLRIHGRALSAAEVAALAADPSRTDGAYALVDESAAVVPPALSLENRHARLVIDTRGRIVSLYGKDARRELLAVPQPLVSARLADGRTITAQKASRSGRGLAFEFARGRGRAEIDIEAHAEFFTFAVRSLTVTDAVSLTFLDVPVAPSTYCGSMANMLSDETDAVCVRGYELPVEMSAGGHPASLRAWTTSANGLTGFRAGLAAGAKAAMPAMLRAMAEDAGAPASRLGGPWALGAEANRGSYLFADLAHEATDDWIELARRGGFTHIHLHGWWRTLGHYDVNTNLYPRGLADMKDSVARIHAAGLKAGIHTLTGCIDPRDPWIATAANADLIPFDTYTLAQPLSPTDTVIAVRERPSDRHDVVFTYAGNGNAIRIGSELVQYAEVRREPPFGFAQVRRGAFGTAPAAHAAGDRADYLQQRYNAFYPQPGSALAGELADRIAGVFNACRLDQIYFDGSEGMMSRAGIDAMRHAIFRRLRGEVLAEASCHGAHNWWFHSRLGAWDHPVWAAKRFQDRHVAVAAAYRATDLLEPQMGWWAPRGPTAQARGHFLDEMEYFAAKNLGLDSAMSIQGVNVSHNPLPGYLEDQFTVLGWYERLRLARYFDTQTVARVAVPGDDFRLRQDRDGAWRFTPVRMDAHRVALTGDASGDQGSARWTWRNPFAAQPLGARIEALYSVAPPDTTNRRCVADFADPAALATATAGPAITLKLAAEAVDAKIAPRALLLTASNAGAARTGAWARAAIAFPAPYLNLSGTGALGVWVRGDGSGALLNLQLASPREYMHGRSDHHVTLDFTGWRYVELLFRERDVDAMYGFAWPYGGGYDIHRNALDLAHIAEFNVYLNNVPATGATAVAIGPVMALPTQVSELRNPSLTVADRTLTVPVTMKSGDFLDVEPSGLCIHRNERGDVLARLRPAVPAAWPVLQAGVNALRFEASPSAAPSPRAEVTPIACGAPFGGMNDRRKIAWDRLVREYAMTREIAGPAGDDDAWDIAVRPGAKAALEIELEGAVTEPVLTIDGCAVRFPVTLKDGERLICRDGRTWTALDAKRATITRGRLETAIPTLASGPHRVAFASTGPVRARVRIVKVYR